MENKTRVCCLPSSLLLLRKQNQIIVIFIALWITLWMAVHHERKLSCLWFIMFWRLIIEGLLGINRGLVRSCFVYKYIWVDSSIRKLHLGWGKSMFANSLDKHLNLYRCIYRSSGKIPCLEVRCLEFESFKLAFGWRV